MVIDGRAFKLSLTEEEVNKINLDELSLVKHTTEPNNKPTLDEEKLKLKESLLVRKPIKKIA